MSKLEFVHAFKPIKFPDTFATSGHTNNSNLTPPLLSTSTQDGGLVIDSAEDRI